MTTYFFPVDPMQQCIRLELLRECNDLIHSTADYMELFYKIFKLTPTVPNIAAKWMHHFIPRANWYGIPLTPAIIVNTALFTVYIRLRFQFAPRNFFYFPVIIQQDISEVQEALEGLQIE